MLNQNVESIRKDITRACESANRQTESVTLVAVTKSVTSEIARPLLDLGVQNFAENRVDKLLEKQEELKEYPIIWHLVGTLQRRKVKSVINRIAYFHGLDNLKLAEEIQKRAEHVIKCFVQVNVSGEESKQGISLDDVEDFVVSLEKYDKINVVGLMTMAPLEATDIFIESCFENLRSKRDQIVGMKLSHAPCHELSMGMSQDYPIAIKAGSTCIRIGTALFKD